MLQPLGDWISVFHSFSLVRFHVYTSPFSSKFVFFHMFLLSLSVTSFQRTKFVACIILFCMSTFQKILIITSDYLLALAQDKVFPYVSETLSKIALAVGTSCGLIYRTILLGCFYLFLLAFYDCASMQLSRRRCSLGAQRQTFLFSFYQQHKTFIQRSWLQIKHLLLFFPG